MKRLAYALTTLLFAIYWSLTFLFNTPDNYIKISLSDMDRLFQIFLSQRWDFFAPPPDYNDKLYFKYVDTYRNKEATYEVLYPVIEEKRKKAPFNTDADVLDCLLSNSLHAISELINQEYEMYRYDCKLNEKDSTKIIPHRQFQDSLMVTIQRYHSFLVLKNYAKIVADKNNIHQDSNKLIIIATKTPIPRFNKRFANEPVTEEILFKSDTLSISSP